MRILKNIFTSIFIIFVFSFSGQAFSKPVALYVDKSATIADHHVWKQLPGDINKNNLEALNIWYEKQRALPSISGLSGRFITKLTLSSTQSGQWFFVPNTNFIDLGLAYYVERNSVDISLHEFSQLADEHPPQLLNFQAFSITMDQYEQGDIWIIIDAKKYPSPVSLRVFSEADFYRFQTVNNSLTVAAVTTMILLALLACLVYFGTGHRVAITCAGYLGIHGIGWAAASGFINDLLNLSINTVYFGMYLFPLAIACASQFVTDLFECKDSHPRTHHFLNGLSIVSLISSLAIWFAPFAYAFAVSHLLAMFWILVTVVVGFKMLTLNDFRAKYFLFGNLLYSVSLAYYVLSHSELFGELSYAELLVVSALAVDCICIILSLTEWFKLKQAEYNRNFYLSRLDPLTKLGNRYALNEEIAKLGLFYVVVYLDLDGLKNINDKFGHAEGDKLITKAAQLLLQGFAKQKNQQGRVFRTGGDEFVVVIPVLNLVELKKTVLNTKNALVIMPNEIQKSWPYAGISYGICDSTEENSASGCLSKADKRMYLQKEQNKSKAT